MGSFVPMHSCTAWMENFSAHVELNLGLLLQLVQRCEKPQTPSLHWKEPMCNLRPKQWVDATPFTSANVSWNSIRFCSVCASVVSRYSSSATAFSSSRFQDWLHTQTWPWDIRHVAAMQSTAFSLNFWHPASIKAWNVGVDPGDWNFMGDASCTVPPTGSQSIKFGNSNLGLLSLKCNQILKTIFTLHAVGYDLFATRGCLPWETDW